MAKSAIVHKVTTTEEIKLSGVVSEDGTTMSLDGVEKKISDFFKKFADKHIDVSMKEKTEEELDIVTGDDEY